MEKFFAAVRNMFNVPDLRRRIFFTLGLLAVYRLGAHVGAPGINKARLDEVWHDVSGGQPRWDAALLSTIRAGGSAHRGPGPQRGHRTTRVAVPHVTTLESAD